MEQIETRQKMAEPAAEMDRGKKVFVVGGGAVGLPLAAFLADQGVNVVAVRSRDDPAPAVEKVRVAVQSGTDAPLEVVVASAPLSGLRKLDGIVVVAVKSHASRAVASALREKEVTGPIVIMQNGVGVETPFVESGFPEIYRCVLYLTSQPVAPNHFTFRMIASSPAGMVKGSQAGLEKCVAMLTTPRFQFHPERDIQKAIWKKAIINAVFNSICPLLEVDNGVFARDEEAAGLAREVVHECVGLAESQGLSLTEAEVMEGVLRISRGSGGILISTLQDIRNGRETEIRHLNLEMARIAASVTPQVTLVKTGLLGRLILAKSRCQRLSAV